MAYDAFLKLDGVTGESKDEKHTNEIDVLSFSMGANNPVGNIGGGGAGAGKVSISSLQIMKHFDAASPAMFQNCCTGKHFPKGQLTLRKAGGTALEYLVYHFEKVFVESVQWSGSSGGDDIPTESLSLAFGKIELMYIVQDDKGGAGKNIGAKWNLETNTAT